MTTKVLEMGAHRIVRVQLARKPGAEEGETGAKKPADAPADANGTVLHETAGSEVSPAGSE